MCVSFSLKLIRGERVKKERKMKNENMAKKGQKIDNSGVKDG